MITDNVNKAEGIVYGAFGVVVSLSRACLLLKLHSGVEAPIRKVCFETSANTRFVAFPVLIGYVCTLAKIQATLSEVAWQCGQILLSPQADTWQ